MRKNRGFTLIELLVVIGIIAMLVAIAIPNYLSARQRASDSRKKSDMVALKNALRLYYNDYNKYPAGSGLSLSGCGPAGASACPYSGCGGDFTAGGATGCDVTYMKKFPTGMLSSILYYQAASGEDFCLRTVLDNKSDPDITTSQARCGTACGVNCTGTARYCQCAD